jgi:hypothetical protein
MLFTFPQGTHPLCGGEDCDPMKPMAVPMAAWLPAEPPSQTGLS